MKHIRTYQQLNESLTSTLYHFTRLHSLAEILRDGQIDMTLAIGTSSDYKINKQKFYFLSMQTTRNGGYGLRKELPVMFVMDGSKLNHNYKGGPVDYWQTQGNYKIKHDMDEFEERVVADKPDLDLKYVKEIHVWMNQLNDDDTYKIVGFAKKKAEELNIPIFFYEDKAAYFNNVKSKAIEVNTDVEDPEKAWSSGGYGAYDILATIVGSDETAQEEMADRIIFNKFVEKSKRDQILKKFKDFDYKWQLSYSEKWTKENTDSDKSSPNSFKLSDMYQSINADIHNGRSSKDKFLKWVFSIMIKEFKKTDTKTFKEFLIKKYGKF